MSNSEGKSPDVLRKAVAELAELENLIDDCEIESDPAGHSAAHKTKRMSEEDDDFIFESTLDFEKKVDFLSQLAEDFAMNLPEDVERAFEEVISALQTKDSEAILGLTEDKLGDDMDGLDYDNYIDNIIKHTQDIDLGDEDDFKFDMKIEGLDEYRQSMAQTQPNDLELALMDVDKHLQQDPVVVVVHSPAVKPLPNLPPDSPTESDIDQVQGSDSPYKSPRADNVDAVASPRVLSPKKVTPTEPMDKSSSPARVITPRQVSSPRHSIEDLPPIEITAPKTPREPETGDAVEGSDKTTTPKTTPRESPEASEPVSTPTPRKVSTPREAEAENSDYSTPADTAPQQDSTEHEVMQTASPRHDDVAPISTPQNTPREGVPVNTPRLEVAEPGKTQTPRQVSTTPREDPSTTEPEQPPQEVPNTTDEVSQEDDSSSSDSDSSDSSDSESSSEEESQPQSPKPDETRTASGNINMPPIPVQNTQTGDEDSEPSASNRTSGKNSRRGSALTAADKQKIIAARREATLKMAQQLRDELKAGTGDPVTKRQRLAQLLNEFKGVQVKGLISIFEQKMKEVVKK